MGIFKSTDYGQSWGLPSVNNRTFFSLAVIGNYIFAGSNGVYVSTNNGLNWNHTSLDSSGSIYSLAVYSNIILAGGYVSGGGFLISTNYGITWSNRSEGGANGVRAICISNGFVFAGTDGGGVLRRPMNELVGIKSLTNQIPSDFKLNQNYPNPFNSTTNILFQIPKQSNVLMKILDVTGKEVEVIIYEKLNAGKYEVTFDANHISSGIYYYRLIVDGLLIDTKKLILIK